MSRVFFTDRDLGRQFPEILRSAGLDVERHHDLFPPDGSDEQWLEYCGRYRRVAITHNERIRYTPNELAAVKAHRVALLIVLGRAAFADLAHNFVATLPKIERLLAKQEPPLIAKVYRPAPRAIGAKLHPRGDVALWFPAKR